MNETLYGEIEEIVQRETRAWDTQNVPMLLTIFHPDMVWPWPPDSQAHDPLTWVMPYGRFDADRWGNSWQTLFDTHVLIHNRRSIRRIEISEQGDGAFAVVDIDTLWQDAQGHEQHWLGRVCKVYARVAGEWKMTMHTGALAYPARKVSE
jgi:ketosteroid isomerase-like protein